MVYLLEVGICDTVYFAADGFDNREVQDPRAQLAGYNFKYIGRLKQDKSPIYEIKIEDRYYRLLKEWDIKNAGYNGWKVVVRFGIVSFLVSPNITNMLR